MLNYTQWDESQYNQYPGQEDPNATAVGQDPNAAPGGGPQGAASQPNSGGEAAAVDQALATGGGGASASPVNPNGSISSTYNPNNDIPLGGDTNPGGAPVEGPAPPTGPVPIKEPPTQPITQANAPWWWNYNNGSPPAVPLGGGMKGWNWDGTRWWQVPTAGISGLKTTGGTNTTGGPNTTTGQGGGNFDFTAMMAALGMGGGRSTFGGFGLPPGMKDPYQGGGMKQFTPPNQSGYENAGLDALLKGLNNSEWGGDRIAQQKEMQKEQALRMRGDLNREVSDRFAGMGRTGSGAQQALQRRGDNETMSHILGAYRGVDQNAAAGRRSELLSTVGALDSALGGQMGRAATGYGAQLSGAQAQAEELYKNWQSRMQMESSALQRAIAEESAKLDWRRTDNQWLQGLMGLFENSRQFNEGMGLDWTKLNLGLVKPK